MKSLKLLIGILTITLSIGLCKAQSENHQINKQNKKMIKHQKKQNNKAQLVKELNLTKEQATQFKTINQKQK